MSTFSELVREQLSNSHDTLPAAPFFLPGIVSFFLRFMHSSPWLNGGSIRNPLFADKSFTDIPSDISTQLCRHCEHYLYRNFNKTIIPRVELASAVDITGNITGSINRALTSVPPIVNFAILFRLQCSNTFFLNQLGIAVVWHLESE